MNIQTTTQKSTGKFRLYGLLWEPTIHPLQIEFEMLHRGGTFLNKAKQPCGNGLYFHMRRAEELLWPDKRWHKWRDLSLEMFCEHTYVGEMGCASAGKTDDASTDFLTDWYVSPECTTTLVCSTTLPSLDLRAWGAIKRYHKQAKARFPWVPGHLIEGARRIVNDAKTQFSEGRDFRNGLIGIACKRGNQYVGIADWIGIHNKRVRVLGDEANMIPRAFVDAIANLSKCEDFKMRALGNPNETTNALGFVCEPSPDLGGWEGNVDQRPGTKVWKTKLPRGVCIQKPGSDSPNFQVPEDEPPPFPFLMTRRQMLDDSEMWGSDDWHYTMFNEARMPRGQGSRRVLTRQMCERFGAFQDPIWRDTKQTKIFFLDAAYRGVGGDRCVAGELQFGREAEGTILAPPTTNLSAQDKIPPEGRTILALIDLLIVPISAEQGSEEPEDQIVKFVMEQCAHRGIGPENFFFDSGMRTSLVTAFSRVWSPYVNSVDCGGKPSEDYVSSEIQQRCCDYYSKRITQLWYDVRLCVESRQFRGMNQDALWEFCAREFKKVMGNKIEVETKEDMKKKTGRSPDLADGVAVGLYGARQRGFVISKLSKAHRTTVTSEAWKEELRKRAEEMVRSKELNYAA